MTFPVRTFLSVARSGWNFRLFFFFRRGFFPDFFLFVSFAFARLRSFFFSCFHFPPPPHETFFLLKRGRLFHFFESSCSFLFFSGHFHPFSFFLRNPINKVVVVSPSSPRLHAFLACFSLCWPMTNFSLPGGSFPSPLFVQTGKLFFFPPLSF